MESLAIKYRPKTWDDVVEQTNIKTILTQQLISGDIKNSYLFVGGAGTGKTTCARIFANKINKGHGTPIEMDAASNNSVDDVRDIIQQAKTKSIDSEYKVFILDECHSLSNNAWQAMLKLIEEPPTKSVFIFCTTDPQKIPKTILSRVQRYDFKMISQQGIVHRLDAILNNERGEDDTHDMDAIEYIAKLAEGHLRDALTMLDKCLAYSKDLTIDNVVKALGVANYDIMMDIIDSILLWESNIAVARIENVYNNGMDIKQFIRQFLNFVIDVNKYFICNDFEYVNIPITKKNVEWLEFIRNSGRCDTLIEIMDLLIQINSEIKWDSNPKMYIEASFILYIERHKCKI